MNEKKKWIIPIIIALVVLVLGIITVIFYNHREKTKAINEYEQAVALCNDTINNYNEAVKEHNGKVQEIIDINNEFLGIIEDAQYVVEKAGPAYDESFRTKAEDALLSCRNREMISPDFYDDLKQIETGEDVKKDTIREIKNKTNTISDLRNEYQESIKTVNRETEILTVPDYTDAIENIQSTKMDLIHSCAIHRQITDPDTDFIISRLSEIEDIAYIAPSTLEHDPNNGMTATNGYKVQIFFSTPLLGTESLKGDELVSEGTSAGGSIEVYCNYHDAYQRSMYLSCIEGFDQKNRNANYVEQLGSMLIRPSSLLSDYQKELIVNEIKNHLLDPDIDNYDKIQESYEEMAYAVDYHPVINSLRFDIPDSIDNVVRSFNGNVLTAYTGNFNTIDNEDFMVVLAEVVKAPEGDFGQLENNSQSRKVFEERVVNGFVDSIEQTEVTQVQFLGKTANVYHGKNLFNGKEASYCGMVVYIPSTDELAICVMIYDYGKVAQNSYPDIYDQIVSSASFDTGGSGSSISAGSSYSYSSNDVSSDFKSVMDEYEKFFDEYIEFMNNYADSPDAFTMYVDYIDMLDQYITTMEAMESIDESTLSEADQLYYIEVTNRISRKLLNAAM